MTATLPHYLIRRALSDSEIRQMGREAKIKAAHEVMTGKSPNFTDDRGAVHLARAVMERIPDGLVVAALTKQLRECVVAMNGALGCTPTQPSLLEETTSDAEALLWQIDKMKERT
jgi:hypothetical protein